MGELSKAVNLGKVLEEQLYEVGIDTLGALKEMGAKQAWLSIQKIDDSACIQSLQALEGAIQGIKTTELSAKVKEDLSAFYREQKL